MTESAKNWCGEGLVIFEWQAWDRYLISHLFPFAKVVPITPFATLDPKPFSSMAEDSLAVLFQISLSELRPAVPWYDDMEICLKSRRATLLNCWATDIRKQTLQNFLGLNCMQTTRLDAANAWGGNAIVKTNLNHGGKSERGLQEDAGATKQAGRLDELCLDAHSYPVMSAAAVPEDWYSDSNLIVERFIANSGNDFHRAYIAGTAIVIIRAYAAGQIKRIEGSARDRNFFFFRDELAADAWPDHPTDLGPAGILRELARFLSLTGLDYGAIDIVNDGEACYIIDVNTTPWAGNDALNTEAIAFLRIGMAQRICRAWTT